MKPISLLLVLLLLFARASFAQDDVIKDTLDWRGYFPLAIGNAWEYTDDNYPVASYPKYRYREVARDTVIDAVSYFIVQNQYFDTETDDTTAYVEYLRYDTTRMNVVEYNPYFDNEEDHLFCGLDADFNQQYECVDGQQVYVYGDYDETVDVADTEIGVPAVKTICYHGPCASLAYGIGDIGGGSEGGSNTISLTYLRIGDQEFGSRVITTAAEETALLSEVLIEPVYPNPATEKISIVLHAPVASEVEFQIYDLLGRSVFQAEVGMTDGLKQRFIVDVSKWASGTYIVQGQLRSGHLVTRTFVLAR